MSNLSAYGSFPLKSSSRPPIILIHGAGTNAAVWVNWQRALANAGWTSYGLDLRGHGRSESIDLSRTSMYDYVEDVKTLAGQLKRPPVVFGWSMGGHIAVMAASEGGFAGCIAMDPDPPAKRHDPSLPLTYGQRTPADNGYDVSRPESLPHMPDLDIEERGIAAISLNDESHLVGSERRQGIVIERMPCPMLEIAGALGDYYPLEPSYYGEGLANERIVVPESSHWGLVLNRRALAGGLTASVVAWLEKWVGQTE
ncbi:MAG: alpha/beta hydrolase [Chloroflexi bacterium]|nr:alpha/beta hydrolase [Chloroflexota bacterium]